MHVKLRVHCTEKAIHCIGLHNKIFNENMVQSMDQSTPHLTWACVQAAAVKVSFL